MTRGIARLGRGAVVAVALAFAGTANAQWINEFHYDNASTDEGEFVEIAGPAGTDLTGWTLLLYNGNGGVVYDTIDLSAAGVLADQGGCIGTYVVNFPSNGIQNGPDGFALVDATNTAVEFITYEGTFSATDGAASGMMSVDVGVAESSATPIGNSLQLGGTGGAAADFTWQSDLPATPGAVNNNQTFSACGATGACCAPDGTCTEGLPGDCSGTYQGDNTLCNGSCPITIGACCDLLGNCTDGLQEADCDGIYKGNESLCSDADVDCLAAPADCPVAKTGLITYDIDSGGAYIGSDYYGSGNDDAFGEFDATTFQFGPADFGGAISHISRAQLTLTVNDRTFSDGTQVEFFFTTDAIVAQAFNGAFTNGIDASQFTYVPVSLGVFTIPEMAGRAGGETDTFSLDLSSVEADLISAINSAGEFQIIIAAVNSADDITYSGVGNTFDEGDPLLAISIPGCPVSGACCDPYGTCSEVPSAECGGDYQGDNTVCADVSCPRLIPTVSEWGLAIMSLIGLAVGTIMFGRQRRAFA